MATTVIVDSFEYRCWHEVGHATVCLHLGGDVDFIEFLDAHELGYARTRCLPPPGFERHVACGGFAAEFYLLQRGFAEKATIDDRDINMIVFQNALVDLMDFWGRSRRSEETFSSEEQKAFMDFAIHHVAPIFNKYFVGMQMVVRELGASRKVEGSRIQQLLRSHC